MSGRLVTLAEPRLQARIDAPNLDAIALPQIIVPKISLAFPQ
jgi:hypothetical protein